MSYWTSVALAISLYAAGPPAASSFSRIAACAGLLASSDGSVTREAALVQVARPLDRMSARLAETGRARRWYARLVALLKPASAGQAVWLDHLGSHVAGDAPVRRTYDAVRAAFDALRDTPDARVISLDVLHGRAAIEAFATESTLVARAFDRAVGDARAAEREALVAARPADVRLGRRAQIGIMAGYAVLVHGAYAVVHRFDATAAAFTAAVVGGGWWATREHLYRWTESVATWIRRNGPLRNFTREERLRDLAALAKGRAGASLAATELTDVVRGVADAESEDAFGVLGFDVTTSLVTREPHQRNRPITVAALLKGEIDANTGGRPRRRVRAHVIVFRDGGDLVLVHFVTERPTFLGRGLTIPVRN